jgi:hypothetical protein
MPASTLHRALAAACVSLSLFASASASSVAADVAAARARASTPRAPRGALPAEASAMIASMWAALAARNASQVASGGARAGERDATDCALDLVSYEMALSLQPERAPLADVFYALSLDSSCGLAPPPGSPYAPLHLAPLTDAQLRVACLPAALFFVDAAHGDDAAPGTLAAPFQTIAHALTATRAARAPGTGTACVVLRGGTHYLGTQTQTLAPADSGLIITGYDGDSEPEAWISGGLPLAGLQWQAYDTAGARNVYVADVPAGVPSVPGLQTLSPLRRCEYALHPRSPVRPTPNHRTDLLTLPLQQCAPLPWRPGGCAQIRAPSSRTSTSKSTGASGSTRASPTSSRGS